MVLKVGVAFRVSKDVVLLVGGVFRLLINMCFCR